MYKKFFYDEMLCFSKLDGSLNFQNVPNFYFILVTNNHFEENSKWIVPVSLLYHEQADIGLLCSQ